MANNQKKASLIRLENIAFTYGEGMILEDVSLLVQPGETLVILGGSGAGKSTLLRLIMGLARPTRGKIEVFGQDITSLSEKMLRPIRRRMGFVFQGGALFDSLSVAENVGYSLLEDRTYDRRNFERDVRQALAYVELEHAYHSLPSELSGGQRKRVAIARATITEPEIILYDEPTAGLDPIVSKRINELINRLRTEKGVTSIVVTHILQDAFAIADRMVMMKDGELVFEGQADELLSSKDPYVQQFVR